MQTSVQIDSDVQILTRALNCLYGLSALVETPGISLGCILEGTVELIPPALQHSEIAAARIVLADQRFETGGFRETAWMQTCDIVVHGSAAGLLQVCYLEERPGGNQEPFLKEEQKLIEAIVQRLGRIVERVRAQEAQIAESARTEDALRKRTLELSLLHRSTQAFGSTLDTRRVLASIIEEVRRLLGIVACSVWLVDTKTGELVCEEASGFQSSMVRGWRMATGQGIVGWVTEHGESVSVSDTRDDPRHFKGIDHRAEMELRSILAVPLQVKGRVLGAIEVMDKEPARFETMDVTLLELLAGAAANAIENAQLYEDLDRARQEWEEIFQAIGHPALILDTAHTVLSANRAALGVTGRSEQEIRGIKCYEVFHSSSHAAGGCPVIAMVESGRIETVEMEMEALGGTFLVSCTPVLDAEGQLEQIIHIATDISDRKRAERRLEQSRIELERRNQVLTTLNQVASEVSQVLTPRMILETVLEILLSLTRVDAGWAGLFEEDGRTVSTSVHRGILSATDSQLERIELEPGWLERVADLDRPLVIPPGAQMPWIAKGHPVPEGPHTLICVPIRVRDRLLGLLVVMSYSTQQVSTYENDLFSSIGRQIGISIQNIRLLEDASEIQILRELDRLRSELIANASHELRTPLGLIRIFSTALLMDDIELDPDTHQKFLTGIADETEKLEGIVDNLLDLSRMESGRLQLDKQTMDLVQLTRDAMAAIEPQLAGHRFVSDLPDEPLIAVVDGNRLQQVIRNLLSNAIKYSPHGGRITVQGMQRAEDISICVSDEGIGIRKEDQDRIFERFYRVDNDTTRRTRGVGLGLAICKWIVEAHMGQIRVESVPGRGSTFCIVLPVEKGVPT